MPQPDFATQLANRNVTFRIPTPVFGGGLIEQISDTSILSSRSSNAAAKSALGIGGRPNFHVAGRTITGQTNNNGNDGTTARFGWKEQNKSLLLFSGEAYNVEMGSRASCFKRNVMKTPTVNMPQRPAAWRVCLLPYADPDDRTVIDRRAEQSASQALLRSAAPRYGRRVGRRSKSG